MQSYNNHNLIVLKRKTALLLSVDKGKKFLTNQRSMLQMLAQYALTSIYRLLTVYIFDRVIFDI